jgi:hypothetical protein
MAENPEREREKKKIIKLENYSCKKGGPLLKDCRYTIDDTQEYLYTINLKHVFFHFIKD